MPNATPAAGVSGGDAVVEPAVGAVAPVNLKDPMERALTSEGTDSPPGFGKGAPTYGSPEYAAMHRAHVPYAPPAGAEALVADVLKTA